MGRGVGSDRRSARGLLTHALTLVSPMLHRDGPDSLGGKKLSPQPEPPKGVHYLRLGSSRAVRVPPCAPPQSFTPPSSPPRSPAPEARWRVLLFQPRPPRGPPLCLRPQNRPACFAPGPARPTCPAYLAAAAEEEVSLRNGAGKQADPSGLFSLCVPAVGVARRCGVERGSFAQPPARCAAPPPTPPWGARPWC